LLALLLSPVKLCWVASVLRVPCPGCGLSRAGIALLHGDVSRALALHPLSIVLVPLCSLLVITQAVRYIRFGRAFAANAAPRWVEASAGILVAMLVVVWIARFLGYFGGPVPV
jgi:hypothetical protein